MTFTPLNFFPAQALVTGVPGGVTTPDIVLFIWPAIVLAAFLFLRPLRAMVITYVIGYLFLPNTAYRFPFVVYDKMVALGASALLVSLITDAGRWSQLRLRWIDSPMLIWCIVPLASAISNGQSAYDGAAESTAKFLIWAAPYFVGRVYLTSLQAMREMAVMMFIGGLIYVPFCLAEAFSGPFWNMEIYGFWQHDIEQAVRDGGFRPMVFLQHGLAVGMYMTAAAILGWWLWWTGSLPRFLKLPTIIPLLVVLVTAAFVRSTGAILLLVIGLGLLHLTAKSKRYVFLYLILFLPLVYVATRTIGGWQGDHVIRLADQWFGNERSQSLAFRFYNEFDYIQRDAQKPILGWGVGINSLIFTQWGGSTIVDSMWIIALSSGGAVGLLSLIFMPVLAIKRLLKSSPVVSWAQPQYAAVAGMIIVLLLSSIDNLANAMINPVFLVGLGGLASLALRPLVTEPIETTRRRGWLRRRAGKANKRPAPWKTPDPMASLPYAPPSQALSSQAAQRQALRR